MRKINLLLLLSLVGFSAVSAAPNKWRKLNPFGGYKKERSTYFVIGTKGYVGTGVDTAEHVTRDFWEYNPGTDTWAQKATFPGRGRRDAIGFSIGTKGYLGMGIDSADFYWGGVLTDFYEYDQAGNSWTPKASFMSQQGTGVYYSACFAIANKGYVCCGKMGQAYYSNAVYEYDPAVDQWLWISQFPGGTRYAMSSFVVGNKAYVGLGGNDNLMNNDWWEFSPTAGYTWVQKADFPPSVRMAATGFSIGNYGYICGGTNGGLQNDLYEYYPPTDTWVQRAFFPDNPRKAAAGFGIGNKGYFGTGKSDSGGRRDFWEYSQILEGVEENTSIEANLFPNPLSSNSVLKITGGDPEEMTGYIIYTVTGEKVKEGQIENAQLFLDKNEFKAGAYFVVLSSNHHQSTYKFLVQ